MPHRTFQRPIRAVLVALAAVVALAVVGPAAAGLAKAGPINPQTGFPAWYQDANGVRLEPCVISVANCFLGSTVPNAALPFSVPGNSPSELFYYDVDSSMRSANGGAAFLRVALEGAFSTPTGDPAAGKQAVFARVRVRVDNLVSGATYTVTHPWGVETLVAGPSAIRSINFTTDIGCPIIPGSPPCDFNLPLAGAVGPFFGWDTGAPAGFLGSFGTPHALQAAGLVPNVFRIEGPNVGGPGVNMIQTDQFQLNAKVAGALTATPANFGLQRVGAGASAPQTVTITNTSPAAVTLGAAAIAGANAADFAVTADACSTKTIAAAGSCTMTLTFTPAAAGDRLATLSFPGDDMSVLLSGTGTAPILSFGPGVTSLPFGSQRVGTTVPHPVVITNNGTAPMTVTGATVAGANASEFAIGANACIGLAIPAGSSCTITVAFTPASAGTKTVDLTVTDDAAGSPHTLAVTGTGTSSAVVLSGSSLTFAPQLTGTMSGTQVLSVGNSGTATLVVGNVTIDGAAASEFQASGCAGASVTPGSSCIVTVRFAPRLGDARDATLTIVDDAGAPHTVALHGVGIAPATPAPQVQPTAPAVAKKTLLALLSGARATRSGKVVIVRAAVSLAGPATVDVSVAAGGRRLTLLKNSRVGAFRTNGRTATIATHVRRGAPVAIELRLAARDVHSGRSYRIVVHARSDAGKVSHIAMTVRL